MNRSAWTLGAACAALLVAAMLPACRSPRASEPVAGPLPDADPAVARGRIAFMRTCQPCHPGGEGGLGPALNDKPAPGFLVKTQVRAGLGAMPSFSEEEIPSETLDDIVAYMFAMRRHRAP